MVMPIAMTLEFEESLIEHVCEGGTIRAWSRLKGKPSYSAAYRHIMRSPEFAKAMDQAREIGHEAIADDCLMIADDSGNDVTFDQNGEPRADAEVVARSKLRVWARLELLKKWHPKKYGDKSSLEHSGPGGAPIAISDEAAAKQIASLLAVAAARAKAAEPEADGA